MNKLKTYQAPETVIITLRGANPILSGSNLGAGTSKFEEEETQYYI